MWKCELMRINVETLALHSGGAANVLIIVINLWLFLCLVHRKSFPPLFAPPSWVSVNPQPLCPRSRMCTGCSMTIAMNLLSLDSQAPSGCSKSWWTMVSSSEYLPEQNGWRRLGWEWLQWGCKRESKNSNAVTLCSGRFIWVVPHSRKELPRCA